MKKTFTTILGFGSIIVSAQIGKIGINTENPEATIDIRVNKGNEIGKTNEGILIPKLSKNRVASISDANLRKGTLIFVDDYSGGGEITKLKK